MNDEARYRRNKSIKNGLQKRTDNARAMLPPGWMLVNDAAKKYGISTVTFRRWARYGTVRCRKFNGLYAIELNNETKQKIEKARIYFIDKKKKSHHKIKEYINEDGEITNFWEWMKHLNSPTFFAIDT